MTRNAAEAIKKISEVRMSKLKPPVFQSCPVASIIYVFGCNVTTFCVTRKIILLCNSFEADEKKGEIYQFMKKTMKNDSNYGAQELH